MLSIETVTITDDVNAAKSNSMQKSQNKQHKQWVSSSVPASIPNPLSRSLDFLWTVAHLVESQVNKANFPISDAHHLVGRIGMWLDKAPQFAQDILTGINSGVDEKDREVWMGDTDTVDLYKFTRDRFSSLYGKLGLELVQEKKKKAREQAEDIGSVVTVDDSQKQGHNSNSKEIKKKKKKRKVK